MSTAQNRIVRGGNGKSFFESAMDAVDSTVSFNQGDLLVFDAATKLLKVPSAESEAETFLGVAPVTVVDGKLKSPYVTDVSASEGVSDFAGPRYGDGLVCGHILQTGSSLSEGDLVYLAPALGAQYLAATGTKPVGTYVGPTISGSVAGQEIDWVVGARFPGDSLRF